MKFIFPLLVALLFSSCQDGNGSKDNQDKDDSTTISTNDLGLEAKPKFEVIGDFFGQGNSDTASYFAKTSAKKSYILFEAQDGEESVIIDKGWSPETNFEDFDWVEEMKVIPKGTIIFNNVVDGEIVGESEVPSTSKISLPADGLFVHIDEGSGGGIIYFDHGAKRWVQQD